MPLMRQLNALSKWKVSSRHCVQFLLLIAMLRQALQPKTIFFRSVRLRVGPMANVATAAATSAMGFRDISRSRCSPSCVVAKRCCTRCHPTRTQSRSAAICSMSAALRCARVCRVRVMLENRFARDLCLAQRELLT
jgi:hypothetical protein